MRSLVLLFLSLQVTRAQIPWPPKWDNFQFTLEVRSREEARTGVTFGRDPDLENPLFRTRIGAQWEPLSWLKLSAMGQDTRAPEYGTPAPSTARESMDLQEGYIELFPGQKGFGALFGRQMASFGEGRLIGVPQWTNTSRTYDTARVYYRLPHARLEFLLLSIVKILPDAFNKPEPGDRLWGMYDSFTNVIPHGVVDAYILRRSQNKPGGFAGPGTLGINTFGGRAVGPAPFGLKYSVEGAVQTGHSGLLTQRAGAWFSGVSRQVKLHWPVDLEVEYKYASGTGDPQGNRSETFDQLCAANHDKFGHEDLFGWRNVHNLRSLDTVHITRPVALNVMYDNIWLASARDALYNGQGRVLALSARGDAGTDVGQELDGFVTYTVRGIQLGAGFGHLFAGEFLRNTTPGVNTRYLYLFQSYSF